MEDTCPAGAVVDPHAQADRYAEATHAAPVADCTRLRNRGLHAHGRLGDDVAAQLACPHPVDGGLVLDVTGLRFLDYESLSHPVGAGERGWTLALRTAWPGVTRLVGLLGVPSVRVEAIV